MSKFFESEMVRNEMQDIQEMQKELMDVIIKFPHLSDEAKVIHIDTVIITEIPKILDYVDEIKNKISNSTGINKEILSIKGKSNEGIGFIGRKEGIAVLSNTTIKITDD